jgi:hypothetical protein
VRLHVRKLAAEQFRHALDRKSLDDVNVLTSTVVTFAGKPLGIFVGEDGSLRLEHRTRDDVLGRDQLDLVLLTTELLLDGAENFRIGFTKYEGELKAACNKVRNATTYEFQFTADSTKAVKDWELVITSTKTKVLFTGLQSGTRYFGKTRAIGARGKISDWSDQADKICP